MWRRARRRFGHRLWGGLGEPSFGEWGAGPMRGGGGARQPIGACPSSASLERTCYEKLEVVARHNTRYSLNAHENNDKCNGTTSAASFDEAKGVWSMTKLQSKTKKTNMSFL